MGSSQRRLDQFFAPKGNIGSMKRKAAAEEGQKDEVKRAATALGGESSPSVGGLTPKQIARAEISKTIALMLAKTRKLRER